MMMQETGWVGLLNFSLVQNLVYILMTPTTMRSQMFQLIQKFTFIILVLVMLKAHLDISINYGRQRGGLLCVGGICRQVSPNTGLTLNITTSF